MSSPAITPLSSRDNPLLKDLRRLSQDSTAYRKLGKLWLEGDHLCRASLERGLQPVQAVFAESMLPQALAQWALGDAKVLSVPDALLGEISGLESPARMGFVLALPAPPVIRADVPTVVLDRLQDAGNVGSILRSAAAFGFRQIIALQGTAALWSQKVLRAGMGAHFGLGLVEGTSPEALDALKLPLLVTSSHQGEFLQAARLPWPCAWVMGHEGQGVSTALMARASLSVRIGQPGGEESLNVAAAAAICLHASAVSRSA
jgi:TrmH family RNA methyltransferase